MTNRNILPHRLARSFCKDKYVVILNSPGNPSESVEAIKENALGYLYLEFHDITSERKHLTPPTKADVEAILEWVTDKEWDDLMFACQAGVSRSSASAFITRAAKFGIDEAADILDPEYHMPNHLMIQYASEILGEGLLKTIDEYDKKAMELTLLGSD